MRAITSMLLTSAALALLATSVAAPALAAPGSSKLAIVQGIPGLKADVCINGREVKSGLRFGGAVRRSQTNGAKMMKVFKAAPGRCRGKLLAQRKFWVNDGADVTIVVSRQKPTRIMVFDNKVKTIGGSDFFLRHAADYGDVTFRQELLAAPTDTVAPANDDPLWAKGDEAHQLYFLPIGGVPWYATTWVTEDAPFGFPIMRVAGPKFTMLGLKQRYEWIFVGNAKKQQLVLLKR